MQKNIISNKNSSKKDENGIPDSFDMVNKYGTYEIQPTADTENQYPLIAQGFNRKIVTTDCENKEAEKKNKKQ